MTKEQQLLKALAAALHDGLISEDMCLGTMAAMYAAPQECHLDMIMALFDAKWQA